MARKAAPKQELDTKSPHWHALEVSAALDELGSAYRGLSPSEAETRQAFNGLNELTGIPPTPAWKVLIKQFQSPLIIMLLIAAIITAFMDEWVDFGAILIVVALNAVLGYWQERKAAKDVRALQSLTTVRARVIRGGAVLNLPSAELTVGDIVVLESGDSVPADLRLISVNGLTVNESMLTGEPVPVAKTSESVEETAVLAERFSMAYSGTLVVSGRAQGLVTGIADNTEIGRINSMITETAEKTPLQLLTENQEKRIGLLIALGVVALFLLGLFLGRDPAEMFRLAVALAVSTIPESLPIGLTIALSVGVVRMARRRAIVRSLPAVETLGSTTIICSDKTGTLTINKMTAEQVWTASTLTALPHGAGQFGAQGVLDPLTLLTLRGGALTNEAVPASDEPGQYQGDPVDAAMASAAVVCEAVTESERRVAPLAHIPYEPELRCSRTVRQEPGGVRVLYVKGAPDAVAAMSSKLAALDPSEQSVAEIPFDASLVERANETFAAEGLRVIAVAKYVLRADEEVPDLSEPLTGMTFLGLEAMADPPREGVAEAIASCRRAGVRVMMITGDHPITAAAIGRRLGIETGDRPLTGAELSELSDSALLERLAETGIAARVSPADKLRIVNLLKVSGDTVAVTGDGVNDAPALRAASIGVAMGKNGTDVAREAADIVLTDDNFVTIVSAIRQGRVTFSTLRKLSYFLFTSSVASFAAVSVNMLTDMPLLFLPVQILWINIVTNGIQDIALAFEPEEGDELARKPRTMKGGLLTGVLRLRGLMVGTVMALIVLLLFRFAITAGYEIEHARTLAVSSLAVMHVFVLITARSIRVSVFRRNFFSNPLLLWAAGLSMLLYLGMITWEPSATLMGLTALSLEEWLMLLGLGFVPLIIVETERLIRSLAERRAQEHQSHWS